MASYFHASPMVYCFILPIGEKRTLNYHALDRYEENFTELQHYLSVNNLKLLFIYLLSQFRLLLLTYSVIVHY